ncbi:MAG: hypothetical protein ABI461_10450 [Polyangiaceae bacterium]
MRKFFLVVLFLSSVGTLVSCSSSSNSEVDDLGPAANAPVLDEVTGPTTADQSVEDGQPGWLLNMTITFHDDHENVNKVTFSASGANTLVLDLPPTNKLDHAPLSIFLLGPTPVPDGGAPGIGYRVGPVQYSVNVIGVSGASSTAIQKNITLD